MKQPRKNDYPSRDVMLYVRVRPDEKVKMLLLANEAGMTISDYVRSKTIGTRPTIKKANPDREALIKLSAELGKNGSNINQIARALNRRSESEELVGVTKEVIENALMVFEKLGDKIYKALSKW